jgi:hypothetical protein
MPSGHAVFDKDEDLAVDFVTAASNLRAACYGIPQQKRWVAAAVMMLCWQRAQHCMQRFRCGAVVVVALE